ncbi:Crp/Fnr family transcriptional regulator [Petrotoga sp. SL27]|uniref:Crp/Fnr family transcriptional regulator n=1 Tax=Petrotoga sp. SL27 TaxID=1445612 RepID=UPI000CDEBA10|nr:Crp/Fnr family transcriptional regulator [Petrotoga sp. SL27]
MDNYIDKIGKLRIFKNFSEAELLKIFGSVRYSIKKFSKGSLIHTSGEKVEKLMILIDGEVITEMIDFNGKILEVERMKSPDVLASALLFSKNNILPVDVLAVKDVAMLYIEKGDLIRLFQSNNALLLSFLEDIGEKFQFVTAKLRVNSFHTIREKITMYLLNLYNQQNKSSELYIPLTLEELANLFGVTRPSLSRAFSQMQKEGLFVKSRNKIILKKLKN